jgi:hypothetical protein
MPSGGWECERGQSRHRHAKIYREGLEAKNKELDMEMKEFGKLAKNAAKVLVFAAAGVASAKYGHDLLAWRNASLEAGSVMSYWIPIIPEGKMLVDSAVLGLMGGVGAVLGVEFAGMKLADRAAKREREERAASRRSLGR